MQWSAEKVNSWNEIADLYPYFFYICYLLLKGSLHTANEKSLPIWQNIARKLFNQIKDDNFIKEKGLFDKMIIDCAFKSNLQRKKKPSMDGGCQYFEPSLTTNGLCYTFNGKHSSELWKDSEITTAFANLFPLKAKNDKIFGGTRTTQGTVIFAKKLHTLLLIEINTSKD